MVHKKLGLTIKFNRTKIYINRWLAEVAMMRFDNLSGMLTGLPRGLKFEDGSMLNMDGIVNEHIQDEAHVWVVLKGIYFTIFHFSNKFNFLNIDDFEGNETTKKTDLKKGATKKKT